MFRHPISNTLARRARPDVLWRFMKRNPVQPVFHSVHRMGESGRSLSTIALAAHPSQGDSDSDERDRRSEIIGRLGGPPAVAALKCWLRTDLPQIRATTRSLATGRTGPR